MGSSSSNFARDHVSQLYAGKNVSRICRSLVFGGLKKNVFHDMSVQVSVMVSDLSTLAINLCVVTNIISAVNYAFRFIITYLACDLFGLLSFTPSEICSKDSIKRGVLIQPIDAYVDLTVRVKQRSPLKQWDRVPPLQFGR